MTDSILYAREGALAHLTFNRPASLNAMGFEMGQRWRDLAREITADPEVGAVLIDASGPAFCAGGDVIEMSTSGSATSSSYEPCACGMSYCSAKARAASLRRDPTAATSRPAVRRSAVKACAIPPVARMPQRMSVMRRA